jgi:hypothetical protein
VSEAALALIRETCDFKSARVFFAEVENAVAGQSGPVVIRTLRICSSYTAKACGRNQAGLARLFNWQCFGVRGLGVLIRVEDSLAESSLAIAGCDDWPARQVLYNIAMCQSSRQAATQR